jgi:hypothetical protein
VRRRAIGIRGDDLCPIDGGTRFDGAAAFRVSRNLRAGLQVESTAAYTNRAVTIKDNPNGPKDNRASRNSPLAV